MRLEGETRLTVAVVSPAFTVIGAVTLISMFWFFRLPRDAGDEMNDRKPS
jgi:hypothetical protein